MKAKNVFKTTLLFLLMGSISFVSCKKENITINDDINAGVNKETTRLKAAATSGSYIIYNRKSGKALDMNTSTGALIQYSYWGGNNQKWVLCAVDNGYFRISPVSNPYLAVDVASQSTAEGAAIGTYSYWGGANEQFQLVDLGTGYYKIVNRNSGKAMDVSGASTANNAGIVQNTYTGATNQQWSLTKVTTSYGNGKLAWRLTTATSSIPADALTRINNAMNAAVGRYNMWAGWASRTLTVEYNTGVPTADGSSNGNIRFGASSDYQNERTALHEISHTYGVGTKSTWAAPLIVNYLFVGAKAVSKVREFDGSTAVINTGGGHFWPYGLNYNSEWTHLNGDRAVQIVWAMTQDGL
jgi:hypothetical protein